VNIFELGYSLIGFPDQFSALVQISSKSVRAAGGKIAQKQRCVLLPVQIDALRKSARYERKRDLRRLFFNKAATPMEY
jgi:hypothetical protein